MLPRNDKEPKAPTDWVALGEYWYQKGKTSIKEAEEALDNAVKYLRMAIECYKRVEKV